jgi:hypothetical protein
MNNTRPFLIYVEVIICYFYRMFSRLGAFHHMAHGDIRVEGATRKYSNLVERNDKF